MGTAYYCQVCGLDISYLTNPGTPPTVELWCAQCSKVTIYCSNFRPILGGVVPISVVSTGFLGGGGGAGGNATFNIGGDPGATFFQLSDDERANMKADLGGSFRRGSPFPSSPPEQPKEPDINDLPPVFKRDIDL